MAEFVPQVVMNDGTRYDLLTATVVCNQDGSPRRVAAIVAYGENNNPIPININEVNVLIESYGTIYLSDGKIVRYDAEPVSV